MSLRVFQIGFFIFTILALGSFIGVIIKVDPETSGLPGTVLFFSSLSAFIFGIIMEIMITIYKRGLDEERAAHYIGATFRQSFLLTFFIFVNLFLLYREIWVWWLALLFFAFVLLLELTARHFKRRES
jgi:ABC-type multidrug transport system permease subunit